MLDYMDTPKDRREFERRFNILLEQILNGRLSFPHGTRMADVGLSAIRYLPNGRLDFLSVNEMARLQANMSVQFEGFVPQLQPEGDFAPQAEPGAAEQKQSRPRRSKKTATHDAKLPCTRSGKGVKKRK